MCVQKIQHLYRSVAQAKYKWRMGGCIEFRINNK